jgi:hypothetical protein
VRIPLDYYQILAVPEHNLLELEQAYRDRLLQLPRQGYSDAAIESRKQLITVAYQVLSDPQQREQYDATRTPPVRTETEPEAAPPESDVAPSSFYRRPDLDIAPEHFIGGLLILFERGEYEEVNSICMPYLGNNGRNSNSGSLHPHPLSSTPSGVPFGANLKSGEPLPMGTLKSMKNGNNVIPLKPDIVLTMVFSFLELGDREWRDSCYEEAVIHFETAQKILVQEDLFPQIQGQIERRLDRLRPYRILSLVALPVEQHERRRQGIQFLEELLESACTNELQCQERFGLNSERTIQFIHETLPHLTAAEQRNLFSQIARNSHQLGASALNVMQLACTYLHVHASIAQGFAYRNPQFIYTAQQILIYRLSQRIDVTIEQAICALLLGQTDEANQILITAPESAPLVVIRQQSQGRPDLLRGLCWYIESWLKEEVFPCFRDLVETAPNPSLDDYFNDRDVQDFAERVPAADSTITGWATNSPQLIDVPPSGDLSPQATVDRSGAQQIESAHVKLLATAGSRRSGSLSASAQLPQNQLGSGTVFPAVRVEQQPAPVPVLPEPAPPEPGVDDAATNVIQLEQERQRRRPSMPIIRTIDGQTETTYLEPPQQTPVVPTTSSQLVPAPKNRSALRHNRTGSSIRRRSRRKPHIPRILLVGTSGVACLYGAAWLANAAIKGLTQPSQPVLVTTSSPSPKPLKSSPLLSQPSPKAQSTAPVGILTPDVAQQLVKTWLSAKTQSLSPEYQTAQLKNILVEPALSSVTERTQNAKASGIYWKYQHQNISIEPMPPIDPQAKVATIHARVKEDAKFYENDLLNPARSYSKMLLVRYSLVRQADRWYIKEMKAIESIDG